MTTELMDQFLGETVGERFVIARRTKIDERQHDECGTWRARVGRLHERDCRDVAAFPQEDPDAVLLPFEAVIRIQAGPQPVRIDAHDGIHLGIERRIPAAHFDGDRYSLIARDSPASVFSTTNRRNARSRSALANETLRSIRLRCSWYEGSWWNACHVSILERCNPAVCELRLVVDWEPGSAGIISIATVVVGGRLQCADSQHCDHANERQLC